MKNKPSGIPQFDLGMSAKAGVMIMNLRRRTDAEHVTDKPHRDTHYLLMLATDGRFAINLDFNHLDFTAPALLLVLPGQVHQLLTTQQPQGWVISVDPLLLDDALLLMLEQGLTGPVPLNPQSAFYDQLTGLMALIESVESGPALVHTSRAIHALLTALLSLIAGQLSYPPAGPKAKDSRAALIEQAFCRLLRQHYNDWKQPAQYAAELAVSVAHLNDTVKAVTGLPVSVHIQQRAILEAKRLLFFTDLSVKEIGYQTGYDEPVYFGKLFKKRVGHSPLQFRQQFRD